ncbi:inhibitor of growth protein 3 isoform X2 [Cylas formicarius]|uniref:inhibitor of growth protein 3 isoform X2 n=1 Tax=Cylas formicarius TaxID=197179 RepID=UPI002958D9BE|nr:inhibitor of growth protein 3 isoform X2 [Cylas formicarius]
MLYLEDYLEMIEHLPQELRDRFTDMREMDLTIHNNMDELEKRVKLFFSECKRYQNQELPQNVDDEYQVIRKEYYKTLEDADEKVHLANQMYDLVDKYLRRLDSELHKFKCELEADNKGITEVLEKRSLELDTPTLGSNISSQQKENRFESVSSNSFRYSRPRSEKRRDSSTSITVNQYPEKRQAVAPSPVIEARHTTPAAPTVTPVTSNISYSLGHNLGAGNAIAAAASQAIAATQQMQQGRRTASLKASYEAINTGGHGHEFIPRELAGAAQTAIQAIQQDHANNKKKQKKWSSNNSSSSSSTSASAAAIVQPVVATPVVPPVVEVPVVEADASNAEVTDGEWTYDPNEPRYCLCNQVSYGDMVACDNEDCPSEWFHYPCVGITAPPKGKWFCPQCTATMKRRGGRKN